MLLQAYSLTSIEFGLVFFVLERENFKRPWLWKASAACILLHIAILLTIFSWDRTYPELAVKGVALTGVLLVAGLIELYLMLWVIEIFRPSDESGKVGPKQDLF